MPVIQAVEVIQEGMLEEGLAPSKAISYSLLFRVGMIAAYIDHKAPLTSSNDAAVIRPNRHTPHPSHP